MTCSAPPSEDAACEHLSLAPALVSLYPQLPSPAPPAVPALSAHVLWPQHSLSPHPCTSASQQLAVEDAVGLQEENLTTLSCAVRGKFPWAAGSLVPQVAVCCETQISLALWPLSHHFTEKNSVCCVELQFTQNPWHRLSSHLAIARTVSRNQHLRQNIVSVLLCSPFNPMAQNQGPPLKIG